MLLLKFEAKNCKPCKEIELILTRLEEELPPIRRIDALTDKEVTKYKVEDVPTLILTKNNVVLKRRVGLLNEKQLRELVYYPFTEDWVSCDQSLPSMSMVNDGNGISNSATVYVSDGFLIQMARLSAIISDGIAKLQWVEVDTFGNAIRLLEIPKAKWRSI